MDATALELDKEEDVEAAQRDRLDGEGNRRRAWSRLAGAGTAAS
jgi:hypothetical protein